MVFEYVFSEDDFYVLSLSENFVAVNRVLVRLVRQ